MRRLFGTDGIRGIAGTYPLDPPTVYAVGRALGHHLPHGPRRVVIGQDTRESSSWIADTLCCGLRDSGAETESAGVLTTPGVAYLTHTHNFSAGVVVSASHNPWQDNGIKVFGPDGYKLADQTELEIEQEIFAQLNSAGPLEAKGSPDRSLPGNARLHRDYVEWMAHLTSSAGQVKVMVDCANGAASDLAPQIFRLCGVQADFIHNRPDGRNINENCGALYPEVVAREVPARHAALGICFDGDADRALFADHEGKVVNGDAVMLLLARELKQQGHLAHNTVVATTMSNMGLEAVLRQSGIDMLRAPVGDKYVLEEMKKTGAILGGEQSGHIILSEVATTGDGLLTALMVLETIARSGKTLAELVADLKVFPQIIKNVRVREKQPLEQIAAIRGAIEQAQRELDGSGRVVVRYSGTEALARVMIEAESKEKMEKHANAIAQAIQETLGS
ncbi:MAG TPA: phosphoglucosamine mutase [Candidatus Angelobacter sp.]|nr:phosphoglucosamine mutase [Candidatus Angelobacter sp.]